jgi:hypothetical protein
LELAMASLAVVGTPWVGIGQSCSYSNFPGSSRITVLSSRAGTIREDSDHKVRITSRIHLEWSRFPFGRCVCGVDVPTRVPLGTPVLVAPIRPRPLNAEKQWGVFFSRIGCRIRFGRGGMSEPAWISESSKPLVSRARKSIGRLQGKTIASVYMEGNMDVLEIRCTDGSVVRLDAGNTNSGIARMDVRWMRQRKKK